MRLTELDRSLSRLYASEGWPSIPPEQLLSTLLLQVFYGIRSERQLIEQLDYNLLYRWFVGLPPDDPGVGRDRVHQEPRPAAERGCFCQVYGQASAPPADASAGGPKRLRVNPECEPRLAKRTAAGREYVRPLSKTAVRQLNDWLGLNVQSHCCELFV